MNNKSNMSSTNHALLTAINTLNATMPQKCNRFAIGNYVLRDCTCVKCQLKFFTKHIEHFAKQLDKFVVSKDGGKIRSTPHLPHRTIVSMKHFGYYAPQVVSSFVDEYLFIVRQYISVTTYRCEFSPQEFIEIVEPKFHMSRTLMMCLKADLKLAQVYCHQYRYWIHQREAFVEQQRTDKEILVGIEPNPGPIVTSVFLLLCCIYFGLSVTDMILIGAICLNTRVSRYFISILTGLYLYFACLLYIIWVLYTFYPNVFWLLFVPQPPLVGIEPNPGPESEVSSVEYQFEDFSDVSELAEIYTLGLYLNGVLVHADHSSTFVREYGHLRFDMHHLVGDDMFRIIEWDEDFVDSIDEGIDVPLPFRIVDNMIVLVVSPQGCFALPLRELMLRISNANLTVFDIFGYFVQFSAEQRHVVAPFLVGVELNPGPSHNDFIIRYYKNLEKLEECASTQKRSTSISKVLVSIERKNNKNKDIALKLERCKRMIVPEGLFDSKVSLDDETKNFLLDIAEKVTNNLSSITTNVVVDVPVLTEFRVFVDQLKEAGARTLKFFLSLAKAVLSLFEPFLYSVFDLVLSAFGVESYYDAPEVQMEMNIPWLTLASTIFAKDLVGIVSKGDWDLFTSILYAIRNKSKDLLSMKDIFTSILKETATFLHDTCGIDLPYLYEPDPFMESFAKEAKYIWDTYSSGHIDDYNFAQRVHIFCEELENCVHDKRKRYTPEQREKFTYMLRKFQPVINYCMRYVNPNNGPRIEPIAIMLAGPTGVGKSTITIPFLLALLSRIMPVEHREAFLENHNDFIFFRATENEFFDGYKARNMCVVYDDFGQMRDTVGAPSLDAFEIIRMKNNAPYHLHFSGIEDKQRHYAVPKVIFATSNLTTLRFNSITCSEAVVRRFDLAYIQVPKKEFCVDPDVPLWDRRMDMKKVRAKTPYQRDDPWTYADLDVIEFVPWDFTLGCVAEGNNLGFWDLLDEAERKFNYMNSKGDTMLKFHKLIKEHPRVVPEMNIENSNSNFMQKARNLFGSIATRGMVVYESVVEIPGKVKTALVVTLAAIALGYKLSSVSTQKSVESTNSKKETKKHVSRRTASRVRARVVQKRDGYVSAQSGDTMLNPYLKLLKRNMYRIGIEGQDDSGWATFVKERVFMVPLHFVNVFDRYSINEDGSFKDDVLPIVFKNPFTGNVVFTLDWIVDTDVIGFQDSVVGDFAFVRITVPKCRIHADITSMFAPPVTNKEEIYKSQMAVIRGRELVFILPDVRVTKENPISYNDGTILDEDDMMTYLSGSLTYSAPTEVGDCGAIILTLDPRFSRPTILGIHTAGTTHGASFLRSKVAYGYFVDKESVDTFTKSDLSMIEEVDVENVQVQGFTALRKAQQPRLPTKSKIEKSEMFGKLWEVQTAPSALTPFRDASDNLIDPQSIARAKYSHSEVLIHERVMDVITPLVQQLVLTNNVVQPWSNRVFTFEEAVGGVNGVDYIDAINRSTSPGYPFVLTNKAKGKTSWLGSDGEIDFSTEGTNELRELVTSRIEKAKKGIRAETVYVDYLKDERRPFAKVQAGKTRQFMACPMDYLIAVKMYFGDWVRYMCTNRIHNGVCVGIDPHSEWNNLAAYLTNGKKRCVTAGDYSGFDCKTIVYFMNMVLETIEIYYADSSEEDVLVRSILWQDIINSLHVSNGIIYTFEGSNPSGEPLTTHLNSVINLLYIAYVGCCNHFESSNSHDPSRAVGDPSRFIECFNSTRFATYGDDNVIAYEAQYEDIFGQQAMERGCKVYLGLEYTNEHKNSEVLAKRSLHEVTFLKRGFRKDSGIWRAPLDLDVIKETLNWRTKNSSLDEMKQRIDCVLAETAHHGKDTFDEVAGKINRVAFKEYNYISENSTYHRALNSLDSLTFK